MKSVEELKDLKNITELYPYYRSDVFAALLIEAGFNPRQIILTRRDGAKGGYIFDIEKVNIRYPYLFPDNPYIEVQTGSQGIYDTTPEDLFFDVDHSHRERDKHHVVSRIKDNRKKEMDLRRIFSLYEVESDTLKVEMSLEELRYQQVGLYSNFRTLFSAYWSVVSLMQNDEFIRLLKVLPYIANMRGAYSKASEAMSYILGISVNVSATLVEVKQQDTDSEEQYQDLLLGVNFTLTTPHSDYKEVVKITLSDIDPKNYPLYFDNKDYNKIVMFLCEMFIEATKGVEIEIKSDTREFSLADSENVAYFGLNTYL